MKKLLAVVTVLAVSTAQAGVVIHVDDDAPAGGDGLTWGTAYRFLQDALVGLADGTEIRVAQGVYKPDRNEANPAGTGDRLARFDLGFDNDCCYPHSLANCSDEACETLVCAVDPLCCDCCLNDWEQACADLAAIVCGDTCQVFSGIVLTGGYAGLGAPDPDARDPALYETVLTGDLLDNDIPMAEVLDPSLDDNSFHLITANGSDLVVEGFVITGAASNAANGAELYPMDSGGGLLVVAGNVTVQSCTFTGNILNAQGGGVGLYLGTQAVMIDCTVIGNRGSSGGGIYMRDGSSLTMINCDVSGNTSGNEGAGVFAQGGELSAVDCIFNDNINQFGDGGGIHALGMTLTLTNCTISGNDGGSEGGGLYIHFTSGNIASCTFGGNSATRGGGVYMDSPGGGVAFDGCTFDSNTAISNGGALNHRGGSVTMTDTLFTGNNSTKGGAVYAIVDGLYRNCVFLDNESEWGGAVFDNGGSDFVGCLFADNTASLVAGGGVKSGSTSRFDNCVFRGNISLGRGGAVAASGFGGAAKVSYSNCVFTGNIAAGEGGAGWFQNAKPVFSNCTCSLNGTPSLGGGWFFSFQVPDGQVRNCIAWGNFDSSGTSEAAQITVAPSSTVNVSYSCIQGLSGGLGGIGNIGTDPMFVDAAGPDGMFGTDDDDVHLLAASPCIDAGNNWGVSPDTADLDGDGDTRELTPWDLDGNPRFNADPADFDPGCGVPVVVDMGAYEFQFDPVDEVFLGDLDGDGIVGIVDFLALLANWGLCEPGCCIADLDIDGDVGIADVLLLLGNWG